MYDNISGMLFGNLTGTPGHLTLSNIMGSLTANIVGLSGSATFNLKTAVGSQKSAQALGAHRTLSQIRQIYCGCAGYGQIFRSFSGNVEKSRQLRSPAFGVLTYSVYAPRAKSPAALLDALFEHSPVFVE